MTFPFSGNCSKVQLVNTSKQNINLIHLNMLIKEQCILGIDAVGHSIAVGLMEQGTAKGAIYLNSGAPSSHTLLASIEQLLDAANLCREDLQGICLTLGPGSFTSMRISLATAEALGMGLNIPLYGTNSLVLMAASIPFYSSAVKVIQNAYKGELYTATYDTSSGSAVELEELQLIKPQAFFDQLQAGELLLGNGIPLVLAKDFDLQAKKVRWNLDFHRLGSGISVIEHFLDCEEKAPSEIPLEPIYIRLSEAEINYKKQFGLTQ
ncbi:MAG: tRNA (adenosine(37)-N6)-threonylcarbamoyltransferase complex dimerization subunit type 1 TsaB [SAR324 cluster bacterium]|uniref:tRNA (Adenosine(37)-N6)-threonylcarbamoyltransferase complex dimerization subunit type 1 TsaB n=1 Tax=SAR324 cluster bacterium TaxID=2024889 RepID=A0A2A4TCD6_9DELT|nr:MAG: tRNA (adenosine(37)-N6)-threonylcarbamoyltransferase complex dimerization subunit type 1 TsaB [SAR324 cluster bacterium]